MNHEIGKNEKKLLEAAANAMSSAYVLWGVNVGAAVLGEDQRVYEGCNVESWISGLGICAERCALNHAVLHGNRRIKEIAVVMDVGNRSEPRPCGSCLQYIHDFAKNGKVRVIMARVEKGKVLMDTVVVKQVSELLPFAYRGK
jgi:cytidine deaminase